MNNVSTPLDLRDTTANPAPLGLLGFGMTTVLLNLHNAGFHGLSSTVLGMGIFYGGIAQVIAGIQEWKKGNTFGATAFTSYGLFWLTLVAVVIMPVQGLIAKPEPSAMAAYLFIWGLFTFIMFFGTLRLNRALQFVFLSLTILFWLLAAADATGNTSLTAVGGWEGLICGLSAMYAGLAQILNELYKKTVWPLGPVK
jgi:uncharacterized protein